MTLQVGDLIPIGGSGDVKKNEVLEGKTYSSDEGVELKGTMPNNGVLSKTITTQGGTQKISPGYYEAGEIKAQFNNLTASNIKKGVNIGGVTGTLAPFSKRILKSGTVAHGGSIDVREVLNIGDVIAIYYGDGLNRRFSVEVQGRERFTTFIQYKMTISVNIFPGETCYFKVTDVVDSFKYQVAVTSN